MRQTDGIAFTLFMNTSRTGKNIVANKTMRQELGTIPYFREIANRVLLSGPVKQLVADGKWLVPASERPRGWESMGVSE